MNSDIRLKLSFQHHAKTKKLGYKLGEGAVLKFIYLMFYAAANKSDGILSGMDKEDIAIAACWEGDADEFVDTLVAVRYLDFDGEIYRIHDWEDNNPWAAGAKGRSKQARSAAAAKWGGSTAQQTRSERLAEARKKGSHTDQDWKNLLEACQFQCLKCGSYENIVKDHIVPLYQGGTDGAENLQPLCRSCNSSKGPDTTDHRFSVVPNLLKLLEDACGVPAERLPNACGSQETPAKTPAPSPSPSPSPKPNSKPFRSNLRFDEFWKAYPKKVDRKKALAKWKARGLDEKADEIIRAVKTRHKTDPQWIDGYIPNPTTYINGDRWEDEYETERKSGKGNATGKSTVQQRTERNAAAIAAADS